MEKLPSKKSNKCINEKVTYRDPITMRRRDVLRISVPTILISTAGCTSISPTSSGSVSCKINNDYDKLTIKRRPQNVPMLDTAIIVGYKKLNKTTKEVVEKSINEGEIKQCHKFNGSQSNIESLWNHISNKWDEVSGNRSEKVDHTFLEKNKSYYGIKLILLDTLKIGSIPND